jgi:hypothetical protein
MRKYLLGGIAALALTTGAQAALVDVTTDPIAGGPVRAIFAFSDAGDTSELSWSQGGPFAVLFNNSTDPVDTTAGPFGALGPMTFRLDNLSTGNMFDTGVLYEGVYMAKASATYADFGVGLPTAAVTAFVAANPGGVFIAFEDRLVSEGSDRDFNDLIYYFAPLFVPTVGVPAPAALGLFGLGLLGLAALRRRA